MHVAPGKMAARLTAGLVVAGICGLAPASALYVDDDAPPGGNGASWSTAFRFLQDAFAYASVPGNGVSEIHVAAGLYLPDRSTASPGGSGDRNASFALMANVAVGGGYAGLGAADPDQHDPAQHHSTLSGDLAGDDLPDFGNVADNSYHVLAGTPNLATVVDGFTITGGNADLDLGSPTSIGGGLYVNPGSVTVANCTFRADRASWGGAIYCKQGSIHVVNCLFEFNCCAVHAGAIRLRDMYDATITGCTFIGNTAEVGAAIDANNVNSLVMADCTFQGNDAEAGAGAILAAWVDVLTAKRCRFIGNSAALGNGAFASNAGQAALANCLFVQNATSTLGGGFTQGGGTCTIVNSVFSRNTASYGAAVFAGGPTIVKNCTLATNGPIAAVGVSASADLVNSIIWGSAAFGPDPGGDMGTAAVNYSDIQGGYPGAANINAAPLFVQAGLDDLRLAYGSPCVNAGSNAALPADALDLDGDGNTVEPLPIDLDGNPRVQGSIVDMGAYEGEFPPGAPAAVDNDLDEGELALLVPGGGTFNPLASSAVIVLNASGPDGATYAVTQYENLHPGAGGYQELAEVLHTQTSLSSGDYSATVFIPFGGADLSGHEPQQINVVWYDVAADAWALAVAADTGDSPGFDGPVGDRILSLEGGAWNVSSQPGDYGVYWDPTAGLGFAWATVDHSGDLSVGASFCPADCRQTPDGGVGILDLLALLSAWGGASGGGPCDLDFDGLIGHADLVALLDDWGACVLPAAAGGKALSVPARDIARSADLDDNGSVDRSDFEALRASWGPCQAPCPGDLDGDGHVGAADLMKLFAGWGTEEP